MYEQILDQFEQLLQQEITDLGGDFARDEEAVWKTILSLGHAALQRIVHRQRNGYHGSQIRCSCGGWMKFVQHRSRDIHSLLGGRILSEQEEELERFLEDKVFNRALDTLRI